MHTKPNLCRLVTALTLAAVAVASTFQPAQASSRGTIRIKGSDTMLLLVQRWSEAFMATHPGVVVDVKGGSTGKGIRALIDGDVDIASASRPLKPDEARHMADNHGTLGYSILTARDALSIYVHPDNPVTDFDLEQLREIFTGKISDWQAIGSRRAQISVLNRNPASGTRLFFANHVLRGDGYKRWAKVIPTTSGIVNAVRRDRDAIGYGGFGYAGGVRACSVNGVEPSAENVRNGHYPISRYLYLYTAVPPAGLVREFIDWVLSDEGQKVVAEVGYIPLREPLK